MDTQQRPPDTPVYAYCHGFLSGPGSVKGQELRKSMLDAGVDMTLLNLNGAENDPGAITCSGAVQAVRDFHLEKKAAAGDPELKLRLVGSSLGGYVAARFVCVCVSWFAHHGRSNYRVSAVALR